MRIPDDINTAILEFKNVKDRLTFVDPARMKTELRGYEVSINGVPSPLAMKKYGEIQEMYGEVIDPNYSFRNFIKCNTYGSGFGFSSMYSFRFGNDWNNEFLGTLRNYIRYDNPLTVVETYAVHKGTNTPGFPNFFDPISYRVRIMQIIGSRYFLSDNGYVCNADEYNYETEELKMRRKYILL